jgi:hypothetical protein
LASSVPAASRRSRTVKSTPTVKASSGPECKMGCWILPPSAPTLESWTESLGPGRLILSAEASPVRTSAPQAVEPESAGPEAGSGERCTGSFAMFDHSSSSWKTSQLSLYGGLIEFSGTWPRAGMTRSGNAYLLPPLVLLTGGTGFGYWPTPVAAMERSNQGSNKRHGPRSLVQVAKENWATPIARDSRTFRGAQRSPNALGSEPLVVQVGGTLNPPWVEWLMGYPNGWTVLQPLETPSFPKSSNGSGVES